MADIVKARNFEYQDIAMIAANSTRKVAAILSQDRRRIYVFDLDVEDEDMNKKIS